jgi:hypothetical protein
MKSTNFLVVIVIAFLFIQCSVSIKNEHVIKYPEPAPDSIALSFLPGIVCTDSLDFNSAFSPDGKSFYFGQSLYGKWRIYVTSFDGKNWSNPAPAAFSDTAYSEADPFITPDGSVYYISNRPAHNNDSLPDYDIWVVHPVNDGTWSAPENLHEVNSDSTEYYVSLSANGNLYFSSNRQGSYGSNDIYISRLVNGKYTTPENLGPAVNTSQMEHDPFISPGEQLLIFTSAYRKDSYGEADLYYSVKNADNTWSPAKNMGSSINTPTYEYCPYITPDSKYLFYSTDFEVKWIDTKYLPVKVR